MIKKGRKTPFHLWKKAEYNYPGVLRDLRLTGKRTQGSVVPIVKWGKGLAHDYSNVPKVREV